MTSVTIDEAAKSLQALIEQSKSDTVVIREGDREIAMLTYLRPHPVTDEEREAAWERAEALSLEASKILEKSLAKDGMTVEQFLADAFADD